MRFHSRRSSAGVSSGNPASQRHYWIFLFFFFSLSRQGGESVCRGRVGREGGGLNRVSLTSEGSAAGAWFSFTSADPRQNTARPFKAPGFEVRGEPQIQALRHICPVWKISSHVRLPAPLKFHGPLLSPCSNREIRRYAVWLPDEGGGAAKVAQAKGLASGSCSVRPWNPLPC